MNHEYYEPELVVRNLLVYTNSYIKNTSETVTRPLNWKNYITAPIAARVVIIKVK